MLINQVTEFKAVDASTMLENAKKKRMQSFGFNTLRGWKPSDESKWIVAGFGTVKVPKQVGEDGKVLREESEVECVKLHQVGATDPNSDQIVALWEFKSRPSALTNAAGEEIWSCQTSIPAAFDNGEIVAFLATQTPDPATGVMSNKVLTISILTGYLTSLKGKKYAKDVLKWS